MCWDLFCHHFRSKTVIVDKAGEETNLPVGSVTYAIPQKTSEVSVGTPILVQKDSRTYKYTITNLDTSKGTGTVTDQSVSGGKTLTVKLEITFQKVVITIGFYMDTFLWLRRALRVLLSWDL